MGDEWMQGLDATPAERDGPRVITALEAVREWIREEQRPDDQSLQLGFPTIDRGLGKPIRRGEVVLFAARTGVGKTWLVQHALETYLAEHWQVTALLVSLEMPSFQIGERVAIRELDVSPQRARQMVHDHEITEGSVDAMNADLSRFGVMDEGIPVSGIPRALEAAEAQLGARPRIVAVDYLGLLRWQGKHVSVYERASETSRQLKQLAKEEDVILLAAVQLSRGGGGDGSREPTLESMRDSGVIEEAADRVLVFWRDILEDADQPQRMGGAQIHCRIVKNRHGPIGYPALLRYSESLKLEEVVEEEIPY